MVEKELVEISLASPKREVCGIIGSDGKVYPIKNVARSDNDFVFDKGEYFYTLSKLKRAGVTVAAIYHSHVNGNHNLTESDLLSMSRLKCTFILIVGDRVRWFNYE